MLQSLLGLDAHARAHGNLVERTTVGAIVTMMGAALAIALFVNELCVSLQPHRMEQMGVDTARSNSLRINLNASFPALPCQALSIELSDMASGSHDISHHAATKVMPGEAQSASSARIHKWRLDRLGNHIGIHEFMSPHPERGFLFSTLLGNQEPGAFAKALEDKEGCQIEGHVDAQRLSGNLHISVTASDLFSLPATQAKLRAALLAAQQGDPTALITAQPDVTVVNVSHSIHHLSFGDEFPGQVHPLDGVTRICTTGTGTHKYFLKVVPTEYSGRGRKLKTNQFSVGEYYSPIAKGKGDMPAVFLLYDLSPITVTVSDSRQSIVHFIVRICAVIGGVVRLTGLLDKSVHRLTASRTYQTILSR